MEAALPAREPPPDRERTTGRRRREARRDESICSQSIRVQPHQPAPPGGERHGPARPARAAGPDARRAYSCRMNLDGTDPDDVRVDSRAWPVFLGGTTRPTPGTLLRPSLFVLFLVPDVRDQLRLGLPGLGSVGLLVAYAAAYVVAVWFGWSWRPRWRLDAVDRRGLRRDPGQVRHASWHSVPFDRSERVRIPVRGGSTVLGRGDRAPPGPRD